MNLRCGQWVAYLSLLAASYTLHAQLRHVQQRTADGVLEGVLSPDGRVRTFKGIPYAAPPVGHLRWAAPQPVIQWTGVRRAIEYPSRCMQASTLPDIVVNDTGPSEDCLYLSMWMPADSPPARLPVMVWINGEDFAAGSSSEPRQDAGNLSKKRVLVITLNYRLGVFGFFSHPELTRESIHHASGNYGLLDQVAALEWIKKNIAVFGGDPDNVTIFGASSGSFSISALMASPMAHGLFRRAIGESGACFSTRDPLKPRLDAERAGVQFAKSAFGTSSLHTLRDKPATELLAAALRQSPHDFLPDVDGDFLPSDCLSIYRKGTQSHIPLLAGWNAQASDEAAQHPSHDQTVALPVYMWLQMQLKTGESPVFRYEFDHPLPQTPDVTSQTVSASPQDAEIEFVFQVLSSKKLPWRPQDRDVSDLISSFWTNFAKTGNPNGPGLPNWPMYNAQDGYQVMHLKVNAAASPDAHRDHYESLDRLVIPTSPSLPIAEVPATTQ
jgi:para-nitrobenzyl esterase